MCTGDVVGGEGRAEKGTQRRSGGEEVGQTCGYGKSEQRRLKVKRDTLIIPRDGVLQAVGPVLYNQAKTYFSEYFFKK